MTYKVGSFADVLFSWYCVICRKLLKDELLVQCAPNSLHTWVGPEVFLFYGIYSLDVERPPAPSPVCNELDAQFWENLYISLKYI